MGRHTVSRRQMLRRCLHRATARCSRSSDMLCPRRYVLLLPARRFDFDDLYHRQSYRLRHRRNCTIGDAQNAHDVRQLPCRRTLHNHLQLASNAVAPGRNLLTATAQSVAPENVAQQLLGKNKSQNFTLCVAWQILLPTARKNI